MKARNLWIGCCVLLALSVSGWANSAPTMDAYDVATMEGNPVTLWIQAEDADIVADHPTAHALDFAIIDGPEHGVLVGDLTAISYTGPHAATLEMTYVPAEGFVGTDVIRWSVTDPLGEVALGTTTIEVTARRTLGTLSGNWSGGTTYNTQTGGFTAFRTQWTEVYRVGALTLKSIASLHMDVDAGAKTMVFDTLRFESDVSLAGFDHHSVLTFDPEIDTGWFDSWSATTRFKLLGIGFTHALSLLDTQTDSYQALSASAAFGAWSISDTLRLDLDPDCRFVFSSHTTSVWWSWCDTRLWARLSFDGDGFDAMMFGAQGIEISVLQELIGDLLLDTSVTFDMDGKSMSAELEWRPMSLGCVEVMSELSFGGSGGPVDGETSIGALIVYGFEITCDLPGAYGDVRVQSATSLDSAYNSRVIGQTDYFEVIRLSGPLDSCCGRPGSWSIATYFHDESTKLFDWGMTLLRADVVLSDHVTFDLETIFRSGFFGDPKLELSVGWNVRW